MAQPRPHSVSFTAGRQMARARPAADRRPVHLSGAPVPVDRRAV